MKSLHTPAVVVRCFAGHSADDERIFLNSPLRMKVSLLLYASALPFLCLRGCNGSSSEDMDHTQFRFPPPNDPSDADLTEGYNPWMKKYTSNETEAEAQEPTFALVGGGCISPEWGGSVFYQDANVGFQKRCRELKIKCICPHLCRIKNFNFKRCEIRQVDQQCPKMSVL